MRAPHPARLEPPGPPHQAHEDASPPRGRLGSLGANGRASPLPPYQVSLGQQPLVFANLSARGIEGTHNPGNAASSNLGSHCLDQWTTAASSARRWDAISFQFGLHDLAFDTERISVGQVRLTPSPPPPPARPLSAGSHASNCPLPTAREAGLHTPR